MQRHHVLVTYKLPRRQRLNGRQQLLGIGPGWHRPHDVERLASIIPLGNRGAFPGPLTRNFAPRFAPLVPLPILVDQPIARPGDPSPLRFVDAPARFATPCIASPTSTPRYSERLSPSTRAHSEALLASSSRNFKRTSRTCHRAFRARLQSS